MNRNYEQMREIVEKRLGELVPECDAQALTKKLNEAMRYSLLMGGKRIRPVLTLSFCAACGEKIENALDFACAVEMTHAYSLIHDDLPCMDDDELRRGKPTCHKVYGEAVAMLAGDALLTKAFETLACAQADGEIKSQAVQILSRCAGDAGMVGGQCIDIEFEGKAPDIAALREMDRGKTVGLILAACKLGCMAAGADSRKLLAAERYAEGVGLAFQIRDDVLDVLGSSGTLGKEPGADTKHEKRNYVSLLGVEKAQELVSEYTKEALEALNGFEGDVSFLADFAKSLEGREH